jgi:hypothetical protein
MVQAAECSEEWSGGGGMCMDTSPTEVYPFPLIRAEHSTVTLQVLPDQSRAEHCRITSAT